MCRPLRILDGQIRSYALLALVSHMDMRVAVKSVTVETQTEPESRFHQIVNQCWVKSSGVNVEWMWEWFGWLGCWNEGNYLSPYVLRVLIGADVMTFWFPLALIAALHDLSAAASHEPPLVWGHVIERGSFASRAAHCFQVATAHTLSLFGGTPPL